MRIKSTLLFMALAVMLVCGVTVSVGYADELSEIERLANQGDVDAQTLLGVMYYDGDGVEQDDVKAAYWTGKAAEQGEAGAQYLLGVMYYNGQGVTQDKQKGCRLYRAAADKNIQEALDLYIKDCQ